MARLNMKLAFLVIATSTTSLMNVKYVAHAEKAMYAIAAGATAEPIIQDFTGATWEFTGKAGAVYALYNDRSHQVTMQLITGSLNSTHGTYRSEFGLSFLQHRVSISIANQEGDILVRSWRDQYTASAVMLASNEASSQNLGSMTISTEPYRPHTGRTVTVNTGTISFSAWSTPALAQNGQNVSQPAYLNFNLTLIAAPAGSKVEGIIGESLHRLPGTKNTASAKSEVENHISDPLKGSDRAYAVSGIFGTDFAFNQFSVETLELALHNVSARRRTLKSSSFEELESPFTQAFNGRRTLKVVQASKWQGLKYPFKASGTAN